MVVQPAKCRRDVVRTFTTVSSSRMVRATSWILLQAVAAVPSSGGALERVLLLSNVSRQLLVRQKHAVIVN